MYHSRLSGGCFIKRTAGLGRFRVGAAALRCFAAFLTVAPGVATAAVRPGIRPNRTHTHHTDYRTKEGRLAFLRTGWFWGGLLAVVATAVGVPQFVQLKCGRPLEMSMSTSSKRNSHHIVHSPTSGGGAVGSPGAAAAQGGARACRTPASAAAGRGRAPRRAARLEPWRVAGAADV
jgi:hypothetical protein